MHLAFPMFCCQVQCNAHSQVGQAGVSPSSGICGIEMLSLGTATTRTTSFTKRILCRVCDMLMVTGTAAELSFTLTQGFKIATRSRSVYD